MRHVSEAGNEVIRRPEVLLDNCCSRAGDCGHSRADFIHCKKRTELLTDQAKDSDGKGT